MPQQPIPVFFSKKPSEIFCLEEYDAKETNGLERAFAGQPTPICPRYALRVQPGFCGKNGKCNQVHLNAAGLTIFKHTGQTRFQSDFFNARVSKKITANTTQRPNHQQRRKNARPAAASARRFGTAPPKQNFQYMHPLDFYDAPPNKFPRDAFPRTKSEAMDRKFRFAADHPVFRKNLAAAGATSLSAAELASTLQIDGDKLHPTCNFLTLHATSDFFKNLLHLFSWSDELKCQIELLQHSQENISGYENISIDHNRRDLIRIKVPGVAEQRPSVMRGDQVLCRLNNPANPDAWEGGYVHFVNFDEILVSFDRNAPVYKENCLNYGSFDVQFTFGSRSSFRAVHRAIDLGTALTRQVILGMKQTYPERRNWSVPAPIASKLNQEQLSFVDKVCSEANLHIVDGPPGAGKTTTLVASILALLDRFSGEQVPSNFKILVTCPSNFAADLIVQRLHEAGGGRGQRCVPLLRVHALARPCTSVDSVVKLYSLPERNGNFDFPRTPLEIGSYKIIVSTLATSSRLYSIGVPQNAFSHVFVDEAGQATESEMMLATTFVANPTTTTTKKTSLILAGDHRQLGPIIHSAVCREAGMGVSALERLRHASVTPRENVVQLIRNYRSHESIVKIVNVTYSDKLVHARSQGQAQQLQLSTKWQQLVQYCPVFERLSSSFPAYVRQLLARSFAKNPVLFLNNEGPESRDEQKKSPSWKNESEIFLVTDLVRTLINRCGFQGKDITVLTPYLLQRKRIENKLFAHVYEDRDPNTMIKISDIEKRECDQGASNTGRSRRRCPIEVATVEAFQGKENKIVIVSCVRSKQEDQIGNDVRHALGFMAQPQRTNVALSRAQDAMIVIGNAKMFLRDPSPIPTSTPSTTGASATGAASAIHQNDRTTYGLWDAILKRISSFEESARVAENTIAHVNNFVNLANPSVTLEHIRQQILVVAPHTSSSGASTSILHQRNGNDDDDDHDALPMTGLEQ